MFCVTSDIFTGPTQFLPVMATGPVSFAQTGISRSSFFLRLPRQTGNFSTFLQLVQYFQCLMPGFKRFADNKVTSRPRVPGIYLIFFLCLEFMPRLHD